MSAQAISELEAAAQIIMAPPDIVSNEQRHSAESIFLNFRKSKSPYGLCREILENSQNQYVMFEAAEVLKGAIIREWSFLLDTDRSSLRQYLVQYITSHEVPHFVRDRIIQVIAIMVKRTSIDDKGKERAVILQEVENLIINGESEKKLLGCYIITNLIQEYATTVKSADVGLPWEVHFKAKKQFEATDLKRIFQFCVYLISEVVKNDPPYDGIMAQLTRHLLQITERILTWGNVSAILPKRLIGIYESVYESDQSCALKLSSAWGEVMFNPEFLPLMFQIYWKVRDVDELAHHAMTCLVQLATLSGAVVSNVPNRVKYLHSYLVNFFKLVSNVTIKDKESLGISSIVRKIVMFYVGDFYKLPEPLIHDTLLDEVTRLTCLFCEGAVREDADPDADRFFSESLENMLEAWNSIYHDFHQITDESITSCGMRIFNKYVQCHLAQPDGIRIPDTGGGNNVDEDIEDNDRIKYKEQLQIVGLFGRCVLSHSLPVLFKILEARIASLLSHLLVMQHRAMTVNEAAVLDSIYEDIHWAVLISGHVLCMESDGETAVIPADIMRYSIEQFKNGKVDKDDSVDALVYVDARPGLPDRAEYLDHTIRVAFNVLRLCAIEDLAVSMKLGHLWSPEVSSSLMWFMKRWYRTYLLIPLDNYFNEVGYVFWSCLEKDSDCTQIQIEFIINKIAANLYNFQSEPVVLKDTVAVFSDAICTKRKVPYIIKTEAMAKLISLAENLQPGSLPSEVLRGLYKGFVSAGVYITSSSEKNKYYETILNPLRLRFKNIITQENFAKVCQDDQVQKVVIDLLECLIGIAKGSQMASVDTLFDFLSPILAELPVFLTFYKDYQVIVQLILELFGQCAKYMLCYLRPLDSKKLYESSLATVQAYAKCNGNRLSTETFAEESSCQDLSLVLDVFTCILSRDCIELFQATNQRELVRVTAADVALFGLNFIMPLMTLELLKFPNLCAQFYHLLVLINDIYPEKIANLPQDMLASLLKTIELGLTDFGNDIAHTALDFIHGMSIYVFRSKVQDTPFGSAVKAFLKLTMDLALSHQFNSDMMSNVSATIYCLICSFEDEYQMLVQTLIHLQSDPLVAERLSEAFENLIQGVCWTNQRDYRLRFRNNFEKFIANVHGFLLVK
ncbi:exportin-4-like [Sitophilus oryzae]|uniref:Exportin-4 n=1 Tax=Sitophilus oryzae TaxID=7048 RepID=A0A6J2YKF5_SITOR|nr:exportin-4-like [Sitophilus oryzae]